MGRPLGVGAGLAVAGDAGVDDAGVDRRHVVVAQAQPSHGAGREILQHDVGLAGHFQEQIAAFISTQV